MYHVLFTRMICKMYNPVKGLARALINVGSSYLRYNRNVYKTCVSKRRVGLSASIIGLFYLTKQSGEDTLKVKLKEAEIAEQKKDYPKAEKLFHDALAALHDQEATNEIKEEEAILTKVYILDYLANLALNTGRVEEAEQLFKDTLAGLQQLTYNEDDNNVVEVVLKTAMCHALLEKFTEAEDAYRFCIDTMTEKLKSVSTEGEDFEKSTTLAVKCMDAYHRFLLIRKRDSEALNLGDKLLSLAKDTFGGSHSQVAAIMSSKATTLALMGQYTEAEHYIHQAIDIGKKTNSTDLAAFYCNLGTILLKRDKPKEAMAACSQAVKLAKAAGSGCTLTQAQICMAEAKKKLSLRM